MLKPKLKQNNDGSFPNDFCRNISLYWSEEDAWSGDQDSAAEWRKEYELYDYKHQMGITGRTFHPRIEKRLKQEGWL